MIRHWLNKDSSNDCNTQGKTYNVTGFRYQLAATELRDNPIYINVYTVWMSIILLEAVPYVTILVLNALIIRQILRSYNFRQGFLQSGLVKNWIFVAIHLKFLFEKGQTTSSPFWGNRAFFHFFPFKRLNSLVARFDLSWSRKSADCKKWTEKKFG